MAPKNKRSKKALTSKAGTPRKSNDAERESNKNVCAEMEGCDPSSLRELKSVQISHEDQEKVRLFLEEQESKKAATSKAATVRKSNDADQEPIKQLVSIQFSAQDQEKMRLHLAEYESQKAAASKAASSGQTNNADQESINVPAKTEGCEPSTVKPLTSVRFSPRGHKKVASHLAEQEAKKMPSRSVSKPPGIKTAQEKRLAAGPSTKNTAVLVTELHVAKPQEIVTSESGTAGQTNDADQESMKPTNFIRFSSQNKEKMKLHLAEQESKKEATSKDGNAGQVKEADRESTKSLKSIRLSSQDKEKMKLHLAEDEAQKMPSSSVSKPSGIKSSQEKRLAAGPSTTNISMPTTKSQIEKPQKVVTSKAGTAAETNDADEESMKTLKSIRFSSQDKEKMKSHLAEHESKKAATSKAGTVGKNNEIQDKEKVASQLAEEEAEKRPSGSVSKPSGIKAVQEKRLAAGPSTTNIPMPTTKSQIEKPQIVVTSESGTAGQANDADQESIKPLNIIRFSSQDKEKMKLHLAKQESEKEATSKDGNAGQVKEADRESMKSLKPIRLSSQDKEKMKLHLAEDEAKKMSSSSVSKPSGIKTVQEKRLAAGPSTTNISMPTAKSQIEKPQIIVTSVSGTAGQTNYADQESVKPLKLTRFSAQDQEKVEIQLAQQESKKTAPSRVGTQRPKNDDDQDSIKISDELGGGKSSPTVNSLKSIRFSAQDQEKVASHLAEEEAKKMPSDSVSKPTGIRTAQEKRLAAGPSTRNVAMPPMKSQVETPQKFAAPKDAHQHAINVSATLKECELSSVHQSIRHQSSARSEERMKSQLAEKEAKQKSTSGVPEPLEVEYIGHNKTAAGPSTKNFAVPATESQVAKPQKVAAPGTKSGIDRKKVQLPGYVPLREGEISSVNPSLFYQISAAEEQRIITRLWNRRDENEPASNVPVRLGVGYSQNKHPGPIEKIVIADYCDQDGKPEYLIYVNGKTEWYDYFDAIKISLEAVTEYNEGDTDIGNYVKNYLANLNLPKPSE